MEGDWERLDPERIQQGLNTQRFGRRIVYLETTGSTNDVARELATTGAEEGTLVLAEEQTAGRGRLGRRWLAPPHSSLMMSVIFRPPLAPAQTFRLTMLSGVCAAQAISQVTEFTCRLKWPNDLIVGGRKVGGILGEAAFAAGRLDFAIVGWGINVNLDVAAIPELVGVATSLSHELGRPVSRFALLQQILQQLEAWYPYLPPQQPDRLFAAWREGLETIGQIVRVDWAANYAEGRVVGVSEEGALMLETPSGEILTISAGDVTAVRGAARGPT
ncbi:MAG: biotin--[acetyl-CoA-carboxylase] ligase [Chloroflexi bacterium]|nr:biotin--[acetyl-CoA-carboxylase] ligase [Chloroflexota bacterium]